MPDSPVAVVSGAGSGIGLAVARLLARRSFNLALVGRNEAKLHDAVESLAEHPSQGGTLVVPADIADPEQARSVVDMTLEQWGRIDALVNNAGVAPMVALDETDIDLLYQVFAVNTFGPMILLARAWSALGRSESGCVVNVSSYSTIDPFPGLGVYAASKAALESVTRSIHNEAGPLGIRAFSVAPGAVETTMLRKLFSEDELPSSKTLPPERVAQVVVDCIEGKRPSDVGRVIVLPSPGSDNT